MGLCRIHSIETLGGADGPGVRCVIFFQGCPLRCIYCQNPDTQTVAGGRDRSVADLLRTIERMRPYFGTEGGVTLSGGEPLWQPEAVGELLRACRAAGIHTALDTSGACASPEALAAASLADLLLLDIKHPDPERCVALTGAGLDSALALLGAAERQRQPVWIRHVVVPGWSDTAEAMELLAEMLAPYACVQRVDLLPYHTLGAGKYTELGRPQPLAGTPPADPLKVQQLEQRLRAQLSALRAASA